MFNFGSYVVSRSFVVSRRRRFSALALFLSSAVASPLFDDKSPESGLVGVWTVDSDMGISTCSAEQLTNKETMEGVLYRLINSVPVRFMTDVLRAVILDACFSDTGDFIPDGEPEIEFSFTSVAALFMGSPDVLFLCVIRRGCSFFSKTSGLSLEVEFARFCCISCDPGGVGRLSKETGDMGSSEWPGVVDGVAEVLVGVPTGVVALISSG